MRFILIPVRSIGDLCSSCIYIHIARDGSSRINGIPVNIFECVVIVEDLLAQRREQLKQINLEAMELTVENAMPVCINQILCSGASIEEFIRLLSIHWGEWDMERILSLLENYDLESS
jgi:hypothetical protein